MYVSPSHFLLTTKLTKEFRHLLRRKEKDLFESRSRNTRYISELTNFGVFPQHAIFHIIKVALDDFQRPAIENLCNILEGCGRYLLRNPETNRTMTGMVQNSDKEHMIDILA